MPLGAMGARAAMSSDPGALLEALRLGTSGALLVTVAMVTRNSVNIDMSSQTLRSVVPGAGDQASVWSTGVIAAALGCSRAPGSTATRRSRCCSEASCCRSGGLIARFFLVGREIAATALHDPRGEFSRRREFDVAGLAAWAAAALTDYLARRVGGTLPSLAVSGVTYLALDRLAGWTLRSTGRDGPPVIWEAPPDGGTGLYRGPGARRC
jgi:hypothetical protein